MEHCQLKQCAYYENPGDRERKMEFKFIYTYSNIQL